MKNMNYVSASVNFPLNVCDVQFQRRGDAVLCLKNQHTGARKKDARLSTYRRGDNRCLAVVVSGRPCPRSFYALSRCACARSCRNSIQLFRREGETRKRAVSSFFTTTIVSE
jgi:hypothetical protein